MDLKCLIKLLLEKGYIHNTNNEMLNREVISGLYESEHEDIYKKVKDSEYDKDIVVVEESQYQKNRFYVINIKNLEKGLIFTGEGEENFGFRADHHGVGGIDPLVLVDIIQEKTRFDVLYLNTDGQIYMDLCDTYLREQRVKQEAEREAEILDFLDKLP